MRFAALLAFALLSVAEAVESYNRINPEYYFLNENDLDRRYSRNITAYFDHQPLRHFEIETNRTLAYKIFPLSHAKGSILLLSGRGESMIKYKEVIYEMNKNGYAVYVYDHRGQGFSTHLGDDEQMGHVDDFDDYVKDLERFVQAKMIDAAKPLFIAAHSMGGAVAALYLSRKSHPFKGAFLSSPMIEPALVTPTITHGLCSVLQKRQTVTTDYMISRSSYDEEEKVFHNNPYTHSVKRFEIMLHEFEENPKAKIGGPSITWVAQACRASNRIMEDARNIERPLLLLQAEEDRVVNAIPQESFCNRAPHCKIFKIDGARHELFIESDPIRQKALSAMYEFFESYR